ncbi:MAG: class I SAM-dependent methyltransferase [Magnetococcales bacterium]|nr:class I SAM-dependent methyltransferase [Magnetococcales bacterium]
MENISSLQMRPTHCLFCLEAGARELFPQRLQDTSFTGYAFSARRQRQREHYRIVVCTVCGLVRSDPVLATESLDQLYAASSFLFEEEAPYAALTYINLLNSLVVRHRATIDSLMEIGCSTGFFLEKSRENGINKVIGFEPSASCRNQAPAGIRQQIIPEPFHPQHVAGESFDLACGFQVIDHLPAPLETVRAMVSILNRPGWVLLVCHDVASWSARLLGEGSPIFDVEHIYLFSRKTLSLLMERAGLEVLEIGSLSNTYPLGYWLRMMPGISRFHGDIPDWLSRLPIRLQAGNLYAFGRVRA